MPSPPKDGRGVRIGIPGIRSPEDSRRAELRLLFLYAVLEIRPDVLEALAAAGEAGIGTWATTYGLTGEWCARYAIASLREWARHASLRAQTWAVPDEDDAAWWAGDVARLALVKGNTA